jgi:hypothetical protein
MEVYVILYTAGYFCKLKSFVFDGSSGLEFVGEFMASRNSEK